MAPSYDLLQRDWPWLCGCVDSLWGWQLSNTVNRALSEPYYNLIPTSTMELSLVPDSTSSMLIQGVRFCHKQTCGILPELLYSLKMMHPELLQQFWSRLPADTALAMWLISLCSEKIYCVGVLNLSPNSIKLQSRLYGYNLWLWVHILLCRFIRYSTHVSLCS